jgi:acyl-CoA dehydrogenase
MKRLPRSRNLSSKGIDVRASTDHLSLPFFDTTHRELGNCLADWLPKQHIDERDDRAACQEWVGLLGRNQWLRYCVPSAHGGMLEALDSRALVILRENLAFHSPLADFAFAMQGLGSGAITLSGTAAQQAGYLRAVATGEKIAAFALSEPDAGSDVGAMQTSAVATAGGYLLNGTKTWISNGDLADFYCVFAKTDASAGTRGISCFLVDANSVGLDTSQHIHVMAPHPLSMLRLDNCRVSADALVGTLNGGFKLAMQTLDIFRASVAAAALGMARRAMDEALAHAKQRKIFGQSLADFQLTQAKFGQMQALIDGAALLTYRAAWMRDVQGVRTTAEAAMAKMTATENAQQVIDMALQMHGGRGVEVGAVVEHLYRDIRSLRIYEGATEVQQLIIGKAALGR